LLQLLRKRHVLIIIDSLSELTEETRHSIRPAQAEFPVAALLVTSRLEEWEQEVTKTTIRPLRVHGNRLSAFMDGYLKQRGKRDLFDDPEYFAACSRLSTMVGEREITVLLAKMYAEAMIAAKEHPLDSELPTTIPDLMLSYLKDLNRRAPTGAPDNRTVQRIAKTVAWKCLEQTCRPAIATLTAVLAALQDEPQAEKLLQDLEKRLRLIRTTGAGDDHLRFTLDPLAEYLAGLYLVERCSNHEELWQDFMQHATTQPGAPDTIKGFLVAIYECCVAKGNEYRIPAWVKDTLAQQAGLAPEVPKAAPQKMHV
jgi:hypothetical protein